MTNQSSYKNSLPHERRILEKSFIKECDIDPLILRGRALLKQGKIESAISIEAEVSPVI